VPLIYFYPLDDKQLKKLQDELHINEEPILQQQTNKGNEQAGTTGAVNV